MQPMNQPDTKLPASGAERQPTQPLNAEQPTTNQEVMTASTAETAPVATGATTSAPVAQQTTQAVVAPPPNAVTTPTSNQAGAKHADLDTAGGNNIEKEWVDRADTIMKQYANDPYLEEEEHEDLSAAYLKKRFNLEVKRSSPKP